MTLNYSVKAHQLDGSYLLSESQVVEKAGVVDLSEDQINRLQNGGITVNEGIVVTLPKELVFIPDSIIYGEDRYKILKNVISEHVTILTCGRIALGSAVVEAGA